MQYGYNTGDLSEDEVTDLPSCAFASRSINSNLQHHYLTNLHHNAGKTHRYYFNMQFLVYCHRK